MTDKVQKIREEVVRMHNLLPVMDGDNISINYADRICTTLEMYIDSLQEEPEITHEIIGKVIKAEREATWDDARLLEPRLTTEEALRIEIYKRINNG